MFAGILGTTPIPLGNCATAQAQIPPNIDFYVLLDNSPSMQLPSTSAGVTQMENLTPHQDTGGCAFACHQASTNNSDTARQSLLRYRNGSTYSTTTTARAGRSADALWQQLFTARRSRSTTTQLARNNSITLRLDILNERHLDPDVDRSDDQQFDAVFAPAGLSLLDQLDGSALADRFHQLDVADLELCLRLDYRLGEFRGDGVL